jgi:hypothetical protein
MRRSGLLARIAICGTIAGCSGSPSSPSGVPLFAEARVSMTFTPQNQTFAAAAEAYRQLWVDEGSRIVDGMEQESGLTFPENHVNAVVFEGVSRSGSGNIPMYLRASYPADVKKATLVHELGHRLIAQLTIRPADLDEHRVLFLFLYDLWERLWGKDFADQQVTVESGRTGLYDYASAWRWALSLGQEQRASRFAEIVKANRR